MIEEDKDAVSHTITLDCDFCDESISVIRETRDECNQDLMREGWRLYKKKHICPECLAVLILKNKI